MCSWPLPRAALLFAKQLFMLEQRQRAGWLGLRPNAAAMAAALRASQHELTFLMGHPLWLPFSLEPLLQARTRTSNPNPDPDPNLTLTLTLTLTLALTLLQALRYSPPLLMDVLLAALLERRP